MNPLNTPQDVLTAQEVAALLKLSYRTILNMARRGQIPAAQIAGQWRFLRDDLETWLKAKAGHATNATGKGDRTESDQP